MIGFYHAGMVPSQESKYFKSLRGLEKPVFRGIIITVLMLSIQFPVRKYLPFGMRANHRCMIISVRGVLRRCCAQICGIIEITTFGIYNSLMPSHALGSCLHFRDYFAVIQELSPIIFWRISLFSGSSHIRLRIQMVGSASSLIKSCAHIWYKIGHH